MDPQDKKRLDDLDRAMWGPPFDPESGLVRTVRRIEQKQDADRDGRRKYEIWVLALLLTAIITPAATIILTKAVG